jgi:transketolase
MTMARTFEPARVQLAVDTVKTLSIDAVEKAKSGHPGTPMGLADLTVELFLHHLRYDPKDPGWIGRDRFVLSAGHASMLVYSMLHLAGYDLPMSELQAFRQWDSKTPGHPEAFHTPGVETTTGPLGQGVGNAIGMALGLKMLQARFGDAFAVPRVYCIASDGDVMEGVSAEASSMAGHLGLSNLVVFYDDNKITIEGETELAFSEDVGGRYEAYGWFVQRVDGHDRKEIGKAIRRAHEQHDRPSFIVCRTHIAHGAPNAVDTHGAHGAPLGAEEIALTKKNIGWDPEKHFFVPEDVRKVFAERAEDLKAERAAWDADLAAFLNAHADKAREFDAMLSRAVPEGLLAKLVAAAPEKSDATRNTSNVIQQTAAKLVPALVGGSADLGPSTKTLIKGTDSVAFRRYGGRNLHFGIREHGMGAICNGMALTGAFIPYGSTFLVFSDYMRPSIRLSALMGLQCLWIFTHDSVFLGEDGPTHQPIEQLWALRLIPNVDVVRPADALEVAAAWAMALERKDGPTVFALSRQTIPNLPREAGFAPELMMRGAYVLAEARGGDPEVVIVASGSEVHVAVGAKERLEKGGTRVRVVSAPCLERFARQGQAYFEEVLPPRARKVSIEAGRTLPWLGVIGRDGLAIGIDRFGASAPDKVLGDKLGLGIDAVTARIETWMAR